MNAERKKSIDEIFEEGTPIDEALKEAVREALLRHKKLGNPICEWDGSKVVWIAPEDIDVEDPAVQDEP